MSLLSKFQSLFFWMTPIKGAGAPGRVAHDPVSILVLLDDSHQADHGHHRGVDRQVSILVLLDDSHQVINRGALSPVTRVSILVLLDDSHQELHSGNTARYRQCFNPCSSG